jgi:hypothetical protein
MKKLTIFAFFVAILSSCNNDDTTTTVTENPTIVGKWEFSKEGTLSSNGQEVMENYINECSTKKDYIQFLESGVYNDYFYGTNSAELVDTGNWSKSGNMLTNVTENETVEIIELTATSLKIKAVDGSDVYITQFIKK